MTDDYDSPWKEALGTYFQPFLALFLPAAHDGIDWSRGYQSLDQELRQTVHEAELGPRRGGLPCQGLAPWRPQSNGSWSTSRQTSWDRDFAPRMYTYNYRLFDRYNRDVASHGGAGRRRPPMAARLFLVHLLGFCVPGYDSR